MFVLGLLIATAAMLCLALAQAKHAPQLLSVAITPKQRRLAGWCGWLLTTFCAWLAMKHYGVGVGLVTFLAWACVGAWATMLLVTARRSR
ncbi:MAG: DUF3325 family protein [Pseudomonadota bacterium]